MEEEKNLVNQFVVFDINQQKWKQDLVFSVKLHLGLTPYTLDPYPLSLLTLFLPHVPYPLISSAIPFKNI